MERTMKENNVAVVVNNEKYDKNNTSIKVPSVNNTTIDIKNNMINYILANHQFDYDPVKDQLTFWFEGYTGSIGRQKVEIIRPSVKFTGSSEKQNTRGRQLHITHLSNKINLSRLYCLGKELTLGNITLKEVDELVLNHKDNMGWLEGSIKDNSALDIDNYELVKQGENVKHGKTWYKLESWGEYTTFSARDTVFIKLVEVSDSIDELKELMKTKKLKLSDYGIKDK